MGRKKKEEKVEYLIENCFPRFDRFCSLWKEIIWEYVDTSCDDYFFAKDNIIIKSVAGFTNPGTMRKFINDLWLQDLSPLRKTFKEILKKEGIKHLENLIGLAEDLLMGVIKDDDLDGKTFLRFSKWSSNPPIYPEEFVKVVLRNSESFAIAFQKSVNELIFNLMLLKSEIQAIDEGPMTFKYLGDTDDIVNLFDALQVKGYINKYPNSIAEPNTVLDFKAIFSGKPKINRILWYGNQYELIYFVRLLKKKNLIVNISEPAVYACNCFVNENGEFYKADTLEHSSRPGRTEEIEKIVENNLKGGK